jgi:hypothetical protein
VQGADRGADDQRGPDVSLQEAAKHPDLGGAELAAAAEDEGELAIHSVVVHD